MSSAPALAEWSNTMMLSKLLRLYGTCGIHDEYEFLSEYGIEDFDLHEPAYDGDRYHCKTVPLDEQRITLERERAHIND